MRVAAGAAIDFETDQSHDITIETTDGAGNTYSEVVTISVNDLNEDPTDITLTGGSVDEGAAAGTTVATLSTVDVDAGDSHTYAITNDPSGFFEIVGNEVRVAAGATSTSRPIRRTTSRSRRRMPAATPTRKSSPSRSTTWSTRPRPISPSPAVRSMRTAAAGTTVATLSTVDADAGDSHTYAITNDPSGFFEIVGNEVRVAAGAAIDFETDQSHDITIETTDGAGNTYSEVVTISVNDLNEDPTDITLTGGSVDEGAASRHDGRDALHRRCGRRRQPHLCDHQRSLRLLRDRRQRSSGRGRRQYRLRDRSDARHHDPDDRCRRQHLLGSRHDLGQRPGRRDPDRYHPDRRLGR